jgi:hypothetical protein
MMGTHDVVEPFPLPESPARPAVRRRARVYLAGPITKGDLAHNINQATAAFVELARAGLAPLCPHWSCYSGPALVRPETGSVFAYASAAPNDLRHDDWLAVDLTWVEAADVVLRLPGESTGADQECRHANARGIPVLSTVAQVVSWAEQTRRG